MSDAGLDLFKAVRAALIGDAAINGLVAGRIFSSWANTAATPLIRMSLGKAERFEIDTTDGPADGAETSISVHVFAKEDAPDASRRIASRVRAVLQDAPLALDNSHTVAVQYRDTIQIQDGDDPSLQMAVVRFTAITTAK